jgi:hypothetical protein
MTRGDDDDPETLSEQLDQEADQLERRSEKLGDEVEQVRQDWKRKRADEGVPGAVPPEHESPADGPPEHGRPADGPPEHGHPADGPPEGETSAEGKDALPEREAGDAQAEEESG